MFQVTERSYSWGTLVNAYRDNILVMSVDIYNDGSYRVTQ